MAPRIANLIGSILTLIAITAYADGDTFTQVGTFQIQMKSNGAQVPTFNVQGPNFVAFPQEFGAPPQVVVSFSTLIPVFQSGNRGAAQSHLDISAANITTTGFTPVISAVGSLNLAPVTISWVAVGPVRLNGTGVTKYLVLTVVYAPPGTDGGHSSSSVSYQAGSTTGTSTSASQSFKTANELSFEGSGGFLGNGGGAGVSFEYSQSSSDNQSLDIKKSTTATINLTGPGQDGISHDRDEIWLLLNPPVNLSLSSSAASWMLGDTSHSIVQYVYVGQLNGHAAMSAGVLTNLLNAGITTNDYPDILAQDPLANNPSSLDPQRFVSLNTTFPYEPPYSASDPVPTVTFNVSDSSVSTVGSTFEDTYKVGLTLSASGGFLDFAKSTLKDTASWEWTSKSSQSTSTGTSQSATVTVGGPAYGYTGPTVMQVYFDTIYKTFAFETVPVEAQEVAVKGAVKSATGKPCGMTEVDLVENGVKYRTFTNPKGEYTFFGDINGPATVQAAGATNVVPQFRQPATIQLRQPE